MRKHFFVLLTTFFLVCMFFVVLGIAQDSNMRTWTSLQGSKLEAELVDYQNGVAKLRNKNGKITSVKITQLSKKDQDFLKQRSTASETVDVSGQKLFELVGVTVAKPLPSQEGHDDTLARWNDGTTISLLVRSDDLSIIGMDEEASKVISFVDEKKNDLMKSSEKSHSMGMRIFRPTEPVSCPSIDAEGKWALVVFHAPNYPVAGSKSVTLNGDVVLRAGSGSTITEHKEIDLSGKGQFNAGGAAISVKKQDFGVEMMGDFKMQIVLESKDNLDTIKEFTFFNSQGTEIEYQFAGSGYMGDTNMIYFMLSEDVKTITIQADAYEKFDTIQIPVSLETGIGI